MGLGWKILQDSLLHLLFFRSSHLPRLIKQHTLSSPHLGQHGGTESEARLLSVLRGRRLHFTVTGRDTESVAIEDFSWMFSACKCVTLLLGYGGHGTLPSSERSTGLLPTFQSHWCDEIFLTLVQVYHSSKAVTSSPFSKTNTRLYDESLVPWHL